GTNCKDSVTMGTQNLVHLCRGMIANLAPVRMVSAADHVDDSKSVGFFLRYEDIHQQSCAMHLAINHVDLLVVGTRRCILSQASDRCQQRDQQTSKNDFC